MMATSQSIEQRSSIGGLTTDVIYSQPSFSKITRDCNIYRCVSDYWKICGKPFLQRSLSYLKGTTGAKVQSRKRKMHNSKGKTDYVNGFKQRRLSCDNDCSCDKSPCFTIIGRGDQGSHSNSLVAKVRIESIVDTSNAQDTIDVDVLLWKVDNSYLNRNGCKNEPVDCDSIAQFRLPRNPTGGTNGHTPTIGISVANGSNFVNSFQRSNIWLLFRCKLPVPRSVRQSLRNNSQRHFNPSSMPMSSEYCYGSVETSILYESTGDHNRSEVTVILKRAPPKCTEHLEQHSNEADRLDFRLLRQLLTEDDVEETLATMPVIKLSIIKCLRQNGHGRTNNSHIEEICRRLPLDRRTLKRLQAPVSLLATATKSEQSRVCYQFFVGNARDSGHSISTRLDRSNRCPFCDMYAYDMYGLLKHQRLCHDRWASSLKESCSGFIIELRANPNYDGRIEFRRPCRRKSKRKAYPLKRTQTFSLMALYRNAASSKRQMNDRCLDEFKRVKRNETDGQGFRTAPAIRHTRQYYHSQTCQSLLPAEFDKDSEDEMDPEWLREETQRLIDDFTDVNEGEKAIMKYWNLHMMRRNFFGDQRMFAACQSFLEEHGRQLVFENLLRNFILHTANLNAYGLLSQSEMMALTKQLFTLTNALDQKDKA